MQTVATASRADQTRAVGLSPTAFAVCIAALLLFRIIGLPGRSAVEPNVTGYGHFGASWDRLRSMFFLPLHRDHPHQTPPMALRPARLYRGYS